MKEYWGQEFGLALRLHYRIWVVRFARPLGVPNVPCESGQLFEPSIYHVHTLNQGQVHVHVHVIKLQPSGVA